MKRLMVSFVLIWIGVGAWADDTAMYVSQPLPISDAKVMIVVDTSTSMNDSLAVCTEDDVNGGKFGCTQVSTSLTKMDLAKEALYSLLKVNNSDGSVNITALPDNIGVGLAKYLEPSGTASDDPTARVVLAPVKSLGDLAPTDDNAARTHREHLIEIIEVLLADGSTPLLSSYFETAQYLLGNQSVFYSQPYDAALFVEASTDYVAPPVSDQCIQNMSIVVLTDGRSHMEDMTDDTTIEKPTENTSVDYYKLYEVYHNFIDGRDSAIATMDNSAICNADIANTNRASVDPEFWACAHAVTQALREYDDIKTHVIAFNLEDTGGVMETWANKGGGEFRTPNTAEELAAAFTSILAGPEVLGETFTAVVPTIPRNAASVFDSEDEAYYSLFKPSGKRFWYGNLKSYEATDVIAGRVFNDDGFFRETARSEWLQGADPNDGGDILQGGAAVKIDSNFSNRNLYVSIPGQTSLRNLNGEDLTSCGTDPLGSNTSPICLLRDHFFSEFTGGTPWDYSANADYVTKVESMIGWLMGNDVHNEMNDLFEADDLTRLGSGTRKLYGAPLHSSPVVVNYRVNATVNGQLEPLSRANQDNLVFISTNDGKLYAVDAQTGVEQFSYMPQSMLTRAGGASPVEQMFDAVASDAEGGVIYGLDSPWAVWRQDNNGDGNITANSVDYVYLYGGMRRGGRDYIGLDVTAAASSSQLSELFVLKGGVAGTEMENIGQTWSVPTVGFVRYKGIAVPVLFVGGGYDTGYDVGQPNNPLGAQVYIIVAKDVSAAGLNGSTVSFSAGDIIWWGSSSVSGSGEHVQVSSLTHSVPSQLKTFDLDSDGYTDLLYFGDMGGQLHRFTINNRYDQNGDGVKDLGGASTASQLVTTDVVAQLGVGATGASSTSDDRRFYYPPSVALSSYQANGSEQDYIAIAIGSGWRANPLSDQVNDEFFFIKDKDPFTATDEAVIQHDSLADLAIVDVSEDSARTITAGDGLTDAQAQSQVGLRATLDNGEKDAEKIISSPLIFNGVVEFTTYYKDPSQLNDLPGFSEMTASERACLMPPGATAYYRYDVDTGAVSLINDGLSTSVAAGGLTKVIGLPEESNNDLDDGDPPPDDGDNKNEATTFDATGSTLYNDSVDFSNIRKTGWRRELSEVQVEPDVE